MRNNLWNLVDNAAAEVLERLQESLLNVMARTVGKEHGIGFDIVISGRDKNPLVWRKGIMVQIPGEVLEQ